MDKILQTTNSIAARVDRASQDIHRSADSITNISTRVDAIVSTFYIFGGSVFLAMAVMSGLETARSFLARRAKGKHGEEDTSLSRPNHNLPCSVLNALFSKAQRFEPPGPLTPDAHRLNRITDVLRDAGTAEASVSQGRHHSSFIRVHIIQAPRRCGMTTLVRQALNALDPPPPSSPTTGGGAQPRRRGSNAQKNTHFRFLYVDLKTWCTGQAIQDCSDLDDFLFNQLEQYLKRDPPLTQLPVVILDSVVCLYRQGGTEEHVLQQLVTRSSHLSNVLLLCSDEVVTLRLSTWFENQVLVHRFEHIVAPDPLWLQQLISANTSGALINLKDEQLDSIVSTVCSTFGGDFGEIFKWFERCKRVSPKEAFDLARYEATLKLRSILFPELDQSKERVRMGTCLWDMASRLNSGHTECDFDPEVVAALASHGIITVRSDLSLKFAKPVYSDLMEEWLFRAENTAKIEAHKQFLESCAVTCSTTTPLGSNTESAT